MTGYEKFKSEQEAFDLRCKYEKELHSNNTSFFSVGFMTIMAIVALASCEVPKEPSYVQKRQQLKQNLIVKNIYANSANER